MKKALAIIRKDLNVGERIRTPGLLVRSQTLYPAELRPHNCVSLYSRINYIPIFATCQYHI